MSYSIEQNVLNIGQLAGKYALKDLSNTGKYSGYLNGLPIRRNVIHEELGGVHTITVTEGSLFTIPNGVTETDSSAKDTIYLRCTEDISFNINFAPGTADKVLDSSRFVYVLYDYENNKLIPAIGNQEWPADRPLVNQSRVDLPHIVISYAYYNVKVDDVQCSIPLGYFDGQQNWHTFDSYGFCDSLVWVEEDVDAIFPEGRDYTSNYNSRKGRVNELTFTKFTALDAGPINPKATSLMVQKNGKVVATEVYRIVDSSIEIDPFDGVGYYLILDENYLYYKESAETVDLVRVDGIVKLCDITHDGARLTSMSGANMYRPATTSSLTSEVEKLNSYVSGIYELLGDMSADEFLHKDKGGVIKGKTEYQRPDQLVPTDIVNDGSLKETLQDYAALTGAVFSGVVLVPAPATTNESEAANVGWVKTTINNTTLNKQTKLSGMVSGTYDDTVVNTSEFTQDNFIDIFNKIAPNYEVEPVILELNTWYVFNVPGWIQWNSAEAAQRNALRVGANPATYYVASQVAAWGEGDSSAAACIVPISAGQWAFNYKHSGSVSKPIARFFPLKGCTSKVGIGSYGSSAAYNTDYYEVDFIA